ncbi:MAG: ABC transporter permease [Desulfurococcaceae archaeon]
MGSALRDVLVVMQWDLMKLKNQKIFLAMRVTWFVIQVLVFARAVSYIVKRAVSELIGVDYYYFYLLGVYASLLYSTGISRGYIVAEEFDDGIVEYHLSLPVKRGVLAVGRILGSALSAVLFTLPMMLFVMLIVGLESPSSISVSTVLVSILAAVLFSVSIVGFVVLVVMGVRSTDLTDILMGAVDAVLIRLSTVFYPLPIIEASGIAPYYVAAALNPISHFADFLRILVFPEYELIAKHGVLPTLLYIAGLAAGLLILALEYYEKKLEAGGWK